jgi:hypothetical protein
MIQKTFSRKSIFLKTLERILFRRWCKTILEYTGVARFFLVQHTKTGKMYQIAIKYTKWRENWPNGYTIYHHLPLQDPPKFTQVGIFGLKIYHLATLEYTRARFVSRGRFSIWFLQTLPKRFRFGQLLEIRLRMGKVLEKLAKSGNSLVSWTGSTFPIKEVFPSG